MGYITGAVKFKCSPYLCSYLTLCALCVLSGYSMVWAQSSGSTTGSIVGTVKDPQGAVLVGAKVTARSISTNFVRNTQADSSGLYRLVQLPPGDYQLKVEADGFVPELVPLTLEIGITALVDFTMKVGGTSEEIEVKADHAVEGKTESSTNIDRQRINNLPIDRRNFLDFSLTVARVTRENLFSGVLASSGLSFNGQTARGNNITIDGLDNNDIGTGSVRSTFSQDAVQEFQVLADSYSAEFGRATGGVVNIVTRCGSNDYHGNLFFFNRNDRISAREVFTPFKPDYNQYQFGSTLGGPIKQDKAFFFASFERLSIKQNNIVTISDEVVAAARRQGFVLRNGPVPFSIGTTSVLARADARLTPSDTLWVRYNGGFTYNGAFAEFGGFSGETNGGTQQLDDNSIAVDNTHISSGLNLVNETRLLYARRNQDLLPPNSDTRVTVLGPEGQVIFGRNEFLPQPRQERLYQIVDNVSLLRGRHQLKFGVDFQYFNTPGRKSQVPIIAGGSAAFSPLDFMALSGIPGLPSFTGLQAFDPTLRTPEQRTFLKILAGLLPGLFPGFPKGVPLADLALPGFYAQGFGDARLVVDAKLFSLFIQDEIRLRPNLLVKAGLRYDLNRVRFLPKNNGNLSPRLALSYRPARLPKLSAHAAYGLFFGVPFVGTVFVTEPFSSGAYKVVVIQFPFSVLPFALPGHHFPESDRIPPGVNFVPQLGQELRFQPDLRNSYTQQTSVGFDYFIDNNTAVSLGYNFVRGIKLFGRRDINPIVRSIPGDIVKSSIIGRIDPTRGTVFESESAFDSYYHALTISINRRLAGRFGLLASYTYSKAIDNFSDGISGDVGAPNDPLRPGDERGLSLLDIRNRLVLSGTWELSYTKNPLLRDFQLSGIVDLESGRPYDLSAGIDVNMNGDLGDRPPGLGRNVGIRPGFASVDLRLTRTVRIRERYLIEGIVEAFNLFNRVNISQVNSFFPPDAEGHFNLPPKEGGRFITPRDRYQSAFAPRQFQLGFRLTF